MTMVEGESQVHTDRSTPANFKMKLHGNAELPVLPVSVLESKMADMYVPLDEKITLERDGIVGSVSTMVKVLSVL